MMVRKIDDLDFRVLRHLRDDDVAMDFARERFRWGKRERVFAPTMQGPTGGERALIAVPRGGLPIAFATWWKPEQNSKMSWIDLLWVDPQWRRQGVAKRMLETIVAQHPSPYSVQFGTLIGNAGMLELAEKAGFRRHSIRFERDV